MIHGIGADIVSIERMRTTLARHGERFALRLLSSGELDEWRISHDQARFLAKRFAAKEAFGKALGIGITPPVTLHAVAVGHDARGKPLLCYDDTLARHMTEQGLVAHISLSDEQDYVVAFAVIEHGK
ncbi:MAG: holo-ACP synthase [Azoarcus sp.]|jgi:holo-[acyl-carrier protein] synthase|nr:holo-ACP synthase [Azoarcus sp.]